MNNNEHSLFHLISDIAPGTWLIVDENSVIHSGAQDWMEAAFDYMTKSLTELCLTFPEIPKEDLQMSIEKWAKPYTGSLHLIQLCNTSTKVKNEIPDHE